MKLRIFTLMALAAVLTGCFPARIVTVSPYNGYHTSYATTVTAPHIRTVTTTTRVTPEFDDLSLYLDLQAVGAAFAQSSNIQEFESLINNSSYIISNLDLNGDGYVDYLRVVETIENYAHVFVIQAVLGANLYQDIATIVAEAPATRSVYVQIIGSPYIYGPNYYLTPVFVTRPPIFDHFYRHGYTPWRSPWYWGHFPPFYKRPVPLHLGHYQAYVHTYMHGHQFCHRFDFPRECHFKDFERISRPVQRNDYGQQHPERSFTVRTANIPGNGGAPVTNARDIRERQSASTVTTSDASRRTVNATSSAAKPAGASSTSSRSAATASRSTTTAGSGSASSRAAATGSASSREATSTTVKSRVRSTGSTETTVRTTTPSGTSTVNRSTGATTPRSSGTTSTRTAGSSSSSSRSATTSSSSSRGGSTSASSTRSAGSSSSSTRSASSSSGNSRSASSSSSSTRRR